MGVFFCAGMAAFLPNATWVRLVLWSALGIAIYLLYGYRHSRLRKPEDSAHAPPVSPITPSAL
jgi:APA family basic amino acid/polyamine antiporter